MSLEVLLVQFDFVSHLRLPPLERFDESNLTSQAADEHAADELDQ